MHQQCTVRFSYSGLGFPGVCMVYCYTIPCALLVKSGLLQSFYITVQKWSESTGESIGEF